MQDEKFLVRVLLILSIWILKSPRSTMFGDSVEMCVRNEAKSLKNSLFIFGGRYTVATMVGVGPDNCRVMDSNVG